MIVGSVASVGVVGIYLFLAYLLSFFLFSILFERVGWKEEGGDGAVAVVITGDDGCVDDY